VAFMSRPRRSRGRRFRFICRGTADLPGLAARGFAARGSVSWWYSEARWRPDSSVSPRVP
jgi:hypothetical protein